MTLKQAIAITDKRILSLKQKLAQLYVDRLLLADNLNIPQRGSTTARRKRYDTQIEAAYRAGARLTRKANRKRI